jgi:hypothetical protein
MVEHILRRFKERGELVLAFATVLVLWAGPVAAQFRESTDRDHPVRLTSNEINLPFAPGRDIYYGFVAGPGDLTMTLDVYDTATANVDIYLFSADAREIGRQHWFSAGPVRSDRKVEHINIARRQQITIKISTSYVQDNSPGRFRLRLTGAIDIAQGAPPPGPDSAPDGSGTLRIVMKDGSTQDIDLSRVQRIVIVP